MAEEPRRRKHTARELADRLGISTRTVQRIIAEPRSDFERRARERDEQILAWRAEGVLWREIADRLGISLNAAQKAGERAYKRQKTARQ